MSETVHGSAVLIGADGVLIRGPSGSGKSSLAARLIRAGARLVGDDRITVSACHGRLVASGAGLLEGKLELRGRGIVDVAYERFAVVRLIVDLVDSEMLPRMPENEDLTATVLGVAVPRQPAPARSGQAAVLVEAALQAVRSQARGLRTW